VRSGRRLVLACGGLRDPIEPLREAAGGVEVRYLPSSLHESPAALRAALQAELEALPRAVERVALGYGLCGGGVLGVTAPSAWLAVPRAHDCVALLRGPAAPRGPTSYHLTPGWIADRKDPLAMMEDADVPRIGRERAERSLRAQFERYRQLVLLVPAGAPAATSREQARRNAELLGLEYVERVADEAPFARLLSGEWTEPDFVLVPPGRALRRADFEPVRAAQPGPVR
jgi:hypothetical protein